MNAKKKATSKVQSTKTWSGFDRLRLSRASLAADITIAKRDAWNQAHLKRLRQSADLPGLVPVIEADVAGGRPYAVTPVVAGKSLQELSSDPKATWQTASSICEAAARAMHEAHQRSLFHGALSADDIFVVDDEVAVAGLGLGHGGSPSVEFAQWAAPEVLDGGEVTERSDVFSLGKVLEASIGKAIESVPREVRRLVMWSTSDTPEARPPSALEFASILAEALPDDKKVYNPAFISTSELSNLAEESSKIVKDHDSGVEEPKKTQSAATKSAMAAAAATTAESKLREEATTTSETTVEPKKPATSAKSTSKAVKTEGDKTTPAKATKGKSEPKDDAAKPGRKVNNMPAGEADQSATDSEDNKDLGKAFSQDKREGRASYLVGAAVVAGLAIIGYGLLQGSSEEDSSSSSSAAAPTASSTAVAPVKEADSSDPVDSTEESDTTDSEDPEDSEVAAGPTANSTDQTKETTPTTEVEKPATTEKVEEVTTTEVTERASSTAQTTSSTEKPEAAEPSSTETSLIKDSVDVADAALQIVHAVPGANVDVYADGNLLLGNFKPNTVAGPITIAPATHEIAIYGATDASASKASDRDDEPILVRNITSSEKPASVIAHLDETGAVALSYAEENFSELDPGQGRLTVRHLAGAPEVTGSLDGDEFSDVIKPGRSRTVELDADKYQLSVSDGDKSLKDAEIRVGDGEVVVISVIGSADEGIEFILQRYDGLAAAPVEVPTGNSNLLNNGSDNAGYLLLALTLVMGGSGVAVLRRKQIH